MGFAHYIRPPLLGGRSSLRCGQGYALDPHSKSEVRSLSGEG